MKKIIIKRDALRIRTASKILDKPNTLEAIKISEGQAAVFMDNMNFEFALCLYGEKNRLNFNEEYSGYLVVVHNGFVELNYMTGGRIVLETRQTIWDTAVNELIQQKRYIKVEGGELKYVWAFHCCSRAMLYSAKLKLTDGLLYDKVVEITDEEDQNLKSYLGDYYQKFFIVEE